MERVGTLGDALAGLHPDLEQLERRPARDDLAFGDLPRPALDSLDACFYSPAARLAYPVLLADESQLRTRNAGAGSSQDSWRELLDEHLHASSAGRVWSPLNVVAMPLLPPFDEPGLRLRPVLAFERGISPDDVSWLSEAMVATVRAGRPHVTEVLVFSAQLFARAHEPLLHQ